MKKKLYKIGEKIDKNEEEKFARAFGKYLKSRKILRMSKNR